jgi:hypothetical protein
MGLPDESRKTSNKGSAIEKVFKASSYFLKIQRAVARQLANGSLATRPIVTSASHPRPSSMLGVLGLRTHVTAIVSDASHERSRRRRTDWAMTA